ncbi:MAG: 3'-5' exoribonuclease domain-containing protein [Magnetospiraceae bacterium]
MPALFLSIDVETDGPIPGRNSMLSLGAVAIDLEKNILGEFSCNLHPLPEARPDSETMAWWQTQPAAWQAHREHLEQPEPAMVRYLAFLKGLPQRPVFMGYPAAFDFMFHHWYLIAFTGEDPCGFQALDLKSYAAALLNLPYRESRKEAYPKSWSENMPHDHTALTDARGQAILGINMLRAGAKR